MKKIRKVKPAKPQQTIWHVGFRNSKTGVIVDIGLTVFDDKAKLPSYHRYSTAYLVPREQLADWAKPPVNWPSDFTGKWKFKVGKMPKLKNRVTVS